MIRRNTWILLALLALMLVLAWYLQRPGRATQASTTPTVEVKSLLDVDTTSINGVTIEDNQGKVVSFGKDAQNNWTLAEPKGEPGDMTSAASAINSFTSLPVLSSLEVAPALDVIGLTQPVYVVTLTTSNGQTRKVSIGSATPTGSGYYVKVDSSPAVVVSKYAVDSLLEVFKNPPLLPTPTPAQTLTPTIAPTSTLTPTLTLTPVPTEPVTTLETITSTVPVSPTATRYP
jgi:hypothetical protein